MCWEIFDLFQKSKTAHFLGQFTTRQFWIRKKSHIPRRSARKKEKNVHLRFFIFENSSHTFFNDRKSIFQKFKMCEIMKKSEISQTVLQKCISFKNHFQILGCLKCSWVRALHFSPQTFCRGLKKRVQLLWSLSIIIRFFLIMS